MNNTNKETLNEALDVLSLTSKQLSNEQLAGLPNQSPSKDFSHIKVVAIARTQQQRLAFSDTVQGMGLTLVDCISPNMVSTKYRQYDVDVWLVDSEYDETLYNQLNAALSNCQEPTVLMGFSKAPFLNETYLYAKWQRKLQRKFADMLELPELINSKVYDEEQEEWHYVVFLGASMGGPVAVKAFLDELSPNLPITIILAHHFNEKMINTLPRILNRHNEWRCQVISTSQTLRAGSCFIVPITQKVVFDSTGRVILTQDEWSKEYKPCIGDLLKNTSEVYGNQLIGIIFSGMGEDGTQHIDAIKENQSQIWVQKPSSSACPHQPQAMIDTGACQFVGTPEELAKKLTTYVNSQVQKY